MPEQDREQVEGRDVRVIDGGGSESKQNLGFLHVAGSSLNAQAGLFGLGWTWPHRHSAGHGSEGLGDLRLGCVGIEISDHHQGHVAGHVVIREEGEDVIAAQLAHRGFVADDGAPVGMNVEHGLEQAQAGLALGIVDALLDFFEHDVALAFEFASVEAGIHQRIGENVEPGIEETAGEHQVVDGFIVACPGVDLAARALDLAGDLAHPALLGALEEHVLEHVCDAGQFRWLVGGADLDPCLKGNDRRGVIFFEDYLQAIVEFEYHALGSPFRIH